MHKYFNIEGVNLDNMLERVVFEGKGSQWVDLAAKASLGILNRDIRHTSTRVPIKWTGRGVRTPEMFAQRLHVMLSVKKISIKVLAKKSGTSVSYLQSIVTGTRFPTLPELMTLCRSLKISSDMLLNLPPEISTSYMGNCNAVYRQTLDQGFEAEELIRDLLDAIE